MFMSKFVFVGALALSLGMILEAKADPRPIKQYHVLRLADYEAITGCKGADYVRPLLSAVRFLAFIGSNGGRRNNNLQYARRHTLPLFRSLHHRHATPEGSVNRRCIPSSLRQIGFALRLLDSNGVFGETQVPKQDFAYDPALLKESKIDPRAFPVMSRIDYNAGTGCTVSPIAYDKYRIAFEWVVLRRLYPDRARNRMAEFLEELFASRPTTDGFVNQRCMIPAISRIAFELRLLDGKGRYRSHR